MSSIDGHEPDENDEDTSSVLPRTNSVGGPLHLWNNSQTSSENATAIPSDDYYHLNIENGTFGNESRVSNRRANLLKEFHADTEMPAKEDRRGRKRGKSFTVVAFSKSNDCNDQFVIFDKETEKILRSQDVLALGRTEFPSRAVPRANIEVLIPTAGPIPDTNETKESNIHHLGEDFGFEGPEEEIVFGKEESKPGINSKPNGWEIKVDEKYMNLRKGDWELQFNVEMRINERQIEDDDNHHEFLVELSCAHSMLYLHRIMTNIGLPVFFDASASHHKTTGNKNKSKKANRWCLGGKMRKTKVYHSLLRHLKGNEFDGLGWHPVDTIASSRSKQCSDEKSECPDLLFQTGCILDDYFRFDVFTDERLKKIAYEKLAGCGRGDGYWKPVKKGSKKQKKDISTRNE